jgi:hypothetical protein
MEHQKYLDDLKDIRDIMQRSSRFLSLSGLSGVAAGVIAIAGVYLAYRAVYKGQDYLGYRQADLAQGNLTLLLIIATGTLILSVGAGIFFTTRKARMDKEPVWDAQTRRLLVNLMIPLTTGGILCLILLMKGYIGLVAPLTLIFYGLALVNGSKYTLTEIRSLGILEIGLGLFAMHFIGYGLIFWAIGFGLLHIIYGIIMHIRYGA